MTRATRCRVNGNDAGRVDATNRGLAYGDGLFETIRIKNGLAPLLDLHLARLARDSSRLAIELPDTDVLVSDLKQFIDEADANSVVKLIATRGGRGRGYDPGEFGPANIILLEYPYPDLAKRSSIEGVVLGICETRLGMNPSLAGIKHLNRLEQVLAAAELRAKGLEEGVMLDSDERVIEGTRSNIFVVQEGKLHTPKLNSSGVAGIMRQLVLGLPPEAVAPVMVRDLTLADLEIADEIFLSNAVVGIQAVRKFGDRILGPGKLTKIVKQESEKWFEP